ncbi:HigA family addiction module antitoxin [Candidatus Marithioploca araucensis]|jgi:addiction module HigA family antidote|uniref:HigA family addiction module antitoxin n=1 Tax=Candidatus Marithioploca araucensis TaxID=70273 RepID=A0ABT7VVF7_9GAMM|nr:HigA family addiction module antitoxin [Candidatus Marithioploca araucensis]
MNKRDFEPIHPGEILWEEFLQPMEITQEQLAKDINIPLPQIREIVQGKQNISADMALRLAQFFNMEAQFWMNLQVRYDLICTQSKLSERIKREVRPCLMSLDPSLVPNKSYSFPNASIPSQFSSTPT